MSAINTTINKTFLLEYQGHDKYIASSLDLPALIAKSKVDIYSIKIFKASQKRFVNCSPSQIYNLYRKQEAEKRILDNNKYFTKIAENNEVC